MANNITVSLNADTLTQIHGTLRDIRIMINGMDPEPKGEEGEQIEEVKEVEPIVAIFKDIKIQSLRDYTEFFHAQLIPNYSICEEYQECIKLG